MNTTDKILISAYSVESAKKIAKNINVLSDKYTFIPWDVIERDKTLTGLRVRERKQLIGSFSRTEVYYLTNNGYKGYIKSKKDVINNGS